MPSVYFQPSYSDRSSRRRRAISLGVALAANLLLVAMLLWLAPATQRVRPQTSNPASFQLLPDLRMPSRKTARVKRPSGGAPHRIAPKPAASAASKQPTPPVPSLNMMMLSKQDFAAADISRLPSHADEQASADTAGAGKDSGPADGPGEGPGGERLYDAEWYRPPTHAELAYYLPANGAQTGWGMIACQTVAKYHVDNCRELGDSQPGSGLARAIRQAAWQFLVLPPRLGGRPIIGAWVRIRIDFTETGLK